LVKLQESRGWKVYRKLIRERISQKQERMNSSDGGNEFFEARGAFRELNNIIDINNLIEPAPSDIDKEFAVENDEEETVIDEEEDIGY